MMKEKLESLSRQDLLNVSEDVGMTWAVMERYFEDVEDWDNKELVDELEAYGNRNPESLKETLKFY